MKKAFRCLLASLLAAVLSLSTVSAAFAKNDVTPVVCIHGMGASALYLNPGTEEETETEGFSVASLFTVYNSLLKKVVAATSGEFDDPADLIDEVAALMQDMTQTACDRDGNSLNNVSINNYWTDSLANHQDYLNSSSSHEPAVAKQISDKIGAENVFAFNYDWRLDACETADKLSDFIDHVKAQTGKNKVTLVSQSEGTVIASAYIDKYMYKNDIAKTVFVNGALAGVAVCDLFCMDIYLDKETLLSYLWDVSHAYNNPDFDMKKIAWLSYTLEDAVDHLCSLLNKIVDSPELLSRFYNEVLYPGFGCIPILWEFLPYDSFDKAVREMSAIGFLDKSGALYSKITRYHGVQGRLEQNLNALKAKGVEVAVIANYGTPAIPLTSSSTNQTDVLIDTKYASLGATTAAFGKTLGYTGKYVSADGEIDASSCMLPDNTWFFKGIQHMDFRYNTQAMDFVATLAVTDVPLDLDSIQAETGRTQFMGTDINQNIVDVTQSGSTAGALNITTTQQSAEKKSPPTGNNDIALAFLLSAALTLSAGCIFALRKRISKI